VLGNPAADIVAIAADLDDTGHPRFDIGLVDDVLRARGWHLQAQLAYGAAPASLHLTIDAAASATAGDLATDLAAAVAEVLDAAPLELPAELVDRLRSLDVASVPAAFGELLAAAGLGDGDDFVVDARVNALLNLLDPDVRRVVVALVADLVFTPNRA
jgi:sphinganine-1-phosphate aldolase